MLISATVVKKVLILGLKKCDNLVSDQDRSVVRKQTDMLWWADGCEYTEWWMDPPWGNQ